MSLTRSQLIMGDSGQGPILPGQVQGVKEGLGITIGLDGKISFNAATSIGVVRTNNSAAFNGYFWPSAQGADGTFLSTNAAGELGWNPPRIGSVVFVQGIQPTPARVGGLWFDGQTRTLKVYENLDSTGTWTPVTQGNAVEPGNVSAEPAFTGGTGTFEDPFVLPILLSVTGGMTRSESVITITGLAPYQFVPISDIEAIENNFKFMPSSQYADENGELKLVIYFNDIPQSAPNQEFGALFKVGFDSCYIATTAQIRPPLAITSPGSVSGASLVNSELTYTLGSSSGGVEPISYTWVWKKQSDGSTVQTNGQTLIVPPSLANDRVIVELTATDSRLSSVLGSTAAYPLSPDLIQKAPFSPTAINFPATLTGEAETEWQDEGTTLYASDCIEFKVGAGTWGQGPTAISNLLGTITTRWKSSALCGNQSNGSTISGCIYDATHQNCASLTLDRIPSPFSFNPLSEIIPGQAGESQIIVPMGYNSTAYMTYTGTSTASNIEASINGGSFTPVPIFGSSTLPINPGETLQIRATTGLNTLSAYVANINIGEGTNVQSGSFTLNTSAGGNFTTIIPFPTTTLDVPTAVTWVDGATSLTSTGCIEFKINAGAFTPPASPPAGINPGDTITTRWAAGGGCAGAPHGSIIAGSVTDGSSTNTASLTIDQVPSAFSFTNASNQGLTALVTSNILNITGFNATAYITYSAGTLTSVQASVAGGPWTAIPSSGTTMPINPGESLQVRGTTGNTPGTAYSLTLQIGEGTSFQQSIWTATTSSVTPTVVTPSILTPVNGSTNLSPYASSPAGITLTSSTYTAINGASGTHASTDWEVRSGSTSGTVVFSGNSLTELTSYFLDASLLAPNTAFFAKCRYRSGDMVPVVSDWSAWSQFNTATVYQLSWVTRYSPSWGSANYQGWSNNSATWIGATTNKFVLVPNAGQNSRYSSDGITWSQGPVLSSSSDFYAVCPGFGAGKENTLVAVGQGGIVRKSTDGGATWVNPGGSLNSAQAFRSVVCNPGGTFVAGGEGGVLRVTSDLTATWTSVSSGVTNLICDIVWDDDTSQFIASVTNPSDTSAPFPANKILVSPDGLTWTPVSLTVTPYGSVTSSSNFSFALRSIVIVPGSPTRYIAFPPVNINPRTKHAVSTDLVNWTEYTTAEALTTSISGGGFIVSGLGQWYSTYSGSTPPYVWTQDKAFQGNPAVAETYQYLYTLAYSPTLGRFVAGTLTGAIYSTS